MEKGGFLIAQFLHFLQYNCTKIREILNPTGPGSHHHGVSYLCSGSSELMKLLQDFDCAVCVVVGTGNSKDRQMLLLNGKSAFSLSPYSFIKACKPFAKILIYLFSVNNRPGQKALYFFDSLDILPHNYQYVIGKDRI